jgi:glycosyltransferase involved in cell wall biosynthesis
VAQKRPLIPVQSARILLTNDYLKKVHVHYFGAGDMQREVETCAKDLEINVTMHGWHENWYELCGASSVVLLASNAEGFGNVLIEATAVGIPVVASSRALGVSDAIIPGVTGILISADDAESFAVAIWSASEIEVGDVSRWLARFSPQSSGEHLLHALEKTAGARPRIGGGGGV